MNNYFYIVRYFDEFEDSGTWSTQRGTVAGNDLVEATKNLNNFYPDIESIQLYCLEGTDCGCLEMDTLNEIKDSLPDYK